MKYSIRGVSLQNTHYEDKPNEDFLLFDEDSGALMLLDGVSRDRVDGVYPNPSPSCAANRAFSTAAFAVMLAPELNEAPIDTLARAATAGNAAVAEVNGGVSSDFLPGTVGVLALIRDGVLHYAYIGDSNGGVLTREGFMLFTSPQTAAVHARRKEFTSHEIRSFICNNASHPCGYGVWNGRSGAADFLRMGSIELSSAARVLLYSDGFNGFIDGFDEIDLFEMSADALIESAREYSDKAWMDDRTLVICSPVE